MGYESRILEGVQGKTFQIAWSPTLDERCGIVGYEASKRSQGSSAFHLWKYLLIMALERGFHTKTTKATNQLQIISTPRWLWTKHRPAQQILGISIINSNMETMLEQAMEFRSAF